MLSLLANKMIMRHHSHNLVKYQILLHEINQLCIMMYFDTIQSISTILYIIFCNSNCKYTVTSAWMILISCWFEIVPRILRKCVAKVATVQHRVWGFEMKVKHIHARNAKPGFKLWCYMIRVDIFNHNGVFKNYQALIYVVSDHPILITNDKISLSSLHLGMSTNDKWYMGEML